MEIKYYNEGRNKLPITLRGSNEKLLLMTLAILQNVGRQNPKGMVYVDPRDRPPLKLSLKCEPESQII
jgi:hypothetical protein